jgi:pimeloyl-ACP methyl ester carboxylesterase
LGESEAGPVAAMFAATHPGRTDALIIYGSLATGQPDDDELAAFCGRPGETANLVKRFEDCADHWGEGRTADWIVPSISSPFVRRAFATTERSAVSPGMARGLIDALLSIDVRPALAAISAPTIVLHRKGDVVPIAHGRLLADRIPGARMIELSGSDHAIWTEDADVIVGEIEQPLTGSRAAPEPAGHGPVHRHRGLHQGPPPRSAMRPGAACSSSMTSWHARRSLRPAGGW